MKWFPALFVLAAACGDNFASQPPVLGPLTLTTAEDSPITRTLPITDDGGPPTISVGTPLHGTITNTGASVTYTPAANYHGTDSVVVTAKDGENEVTGTLDITITPVNDAPVATADALAGLRNQTLVTTTAALLSNDTDIDGDTLTVTAVSAASTGTVALAGSTVTYNPPAGFLGQATFAYTMSDGAATAMATVTVTITGTNSAPVAVDDTATTLEDTQVALTSAQLVGNDTDPDAQSLSVMSVGSPAHGTVVLAGTTATFTPEANYSGPATFTYVVTDGTATDTGLVTITVTAVNDAPVAGDDVAMTTRDTALVLQASTLLANDTDVDGPTPTITAVGNPTNGTVAQVGTTITFTPTTNFTGAASFEYTLSDGSLTDTGVVMVNVSASNTAPVAVDDSGTTVEDNAFAFTNADLVGNDTDAEGDTLVVTVVSTPTNGTVALAGGVTTFTPAANFNGTAGFDYTVSDGTATDTGHVTMTITAVNDPPVAVDDTASTAMNATLMIQNTTLTANDTDVENDALSITTVGTATNGTVSVAAGTVTFIPTTGFNGIATFEYTVSDGTASDVGLVRVAVGTVNTPVVATDDTASTPIDTNLVVTHATLLANDVDPDPDTLTITAVSTPMNGTVVLGATDVTFTPTTGFTGTAGFDYTVSDGTATDIGHVTVTVTAVNTAPVAVDDTGTTTVNTQFVVSRALLASNDTDAENDTLTVTAVSTPTNGTVLLGATDITFTPTAGFVGTAGFDYTVSDGTLTDTGHVTITVSYPAGALAMFTFFGSTGSEVTRNAELVATDVASPVTIARSGISASAAAGAFGSSGWGTMATIDLTKYVEFSIGPTSGHTLSLTQLKFDLQRSNSGPATWVLRSSADAFAADIQTGATPTAFATFTVALGGAFANLSAPVTFRIYGYAATGAAGTMREDNILFTGTVGP